LNLAEASADMDLQRMEEARTMAEYSGYSSMYNAGQQNIAGGVSGLAGSAALYGYMNPSGGGGVGVNNVNPAGSVNALNPSGVVNTSTPLTAPSLMNMPASNNALNAPNLPNNYNSFYQSPFL
jgi:hypothetical protein